MPYPSYAKLTDADVAALYGFFMKQVPPVRQANLKSEIPALLSPRWPLRSDALSLLRQADRRRRGGALRLLHEAGPPRPSGEFEERDSGAAQPPLAAQI